MLRYRSYWVFFGSSVVVPDEAVEPPLEGLDGVVVAPPDAEPGLAVSSFGASDEGAAAPEGGVAALLLEDAPGVAGVAAVPPAELDDEPGAVEGADGGGVEAVLEPELEGGALVVRSGLSQAARPKASATAIARVESFMCPPWLG